jgi:DNA polymerase III delta prime subunit
MLKDLWAIKYRPKTFDSYIFQDEHQKVIIEQFVVDKSIPHLMLIGHRGTGKTSLAFVLKNLLGVDDYDFMHLNASHDNSVDTIRHKVTTFASTIPAGDFKIVLLDEADWLTAAAQATLRGILEDEDMVKNVRFIFTCNHPQKIIPEIHSRCQDFKFKTMDKEQMLGIAAEILISEHVKVGSEELLQKYVDLASPDLRKLINLLQKNTVGGKLQEPATNDASMEYQLELLDLIDSGNWERARELVCENVEGDDWMEVYRFIYDYIHEVGRFKEVKKWKQAIVIIADHLYRHATVGDAEINFTACIIRLTEV